MPTLEVAIKASKAAEGAQQFTNAADAVKRGAKGASDRVDRLNHDLLGLGSTAGKMKHLLGGLFASIGAGLALTKAISVISQFEDVMLQLKGVTGATADVMQEFEDRARSLGATTRYSASLAAEAILNLSRAGFTANESLAGVAGTLDLASAGVLQLALASEIAAVTVRQFGLAASDTVRVGDVFVTTANKANTTVTDLGEAMKFAGPAAKALGITLEETAAAVGVLGDAGIPGAMAGTRLRAAFTALVTPTNKAKEALASMGLTVEDVSPKTNTLVEIFAKLRDAGMGMEEAVAIFDVQTAVSAISMANAADKMRELTAANEESAGTAARAARIMEQGITQAFDNLGGAVEELYLVLGESGLTRALMAVLGAATDVVLVFAGMQDQIAGNKAMAILLARGIETIAVAGATLIALQLPRYLMQAAVAMKAFAVATAAHPILALAAGFSLLVGALVAFRNTAIEVGGTATTLAAEFGKLASMTAGLWGFKDAAEMLDTLKQKFAEVTAAVLQFGETLLGSLAPYLIQVRNIIAATWSTAAQLVIDAMNIIGTAVSTTMAFINTVLQSAGLGSIGDMMDFLIGKAGAFKEAFITALVAVEFGISNWEALATLAFTKVAKGAIDIKDLIVHIFGTAIPGVLSFLGENWQQIFTDMGMLAYQVIVNTISNITAVITNGVNDIFDWLISVWDINWSDLGMRAVKLLKGAFEGIGKLFQTLWDFITGKLGKADAGAAFERVVADVIPDSHMEKREGAEARERMQIKGITEGFESSIDPAAVDKLKKDLTEVAQSDTSKRLEESIAAREAALAEGFDSLLQQRMKEVMPHQASDAQPAEDTVKEVVAPKASPGMPEVPAKSAGGVSAETEIGTAGIEIDDRFTGIRALFEGQMALGDPVVNAVVDQTASIVGKLDEVKEAVSTIAGGETETSITRLNDRDDGLSVSKVKGPGGVETPRAGSESPEQRKTQINIEKATQSSAMSLQAIQRLLEDAKSESIVLSFE